MKLAYYLLFILVITNVAAAEDDPPSFVVNVIARVSSKFKPLEGISEYREAVNGLPYYIFKGTKFTKATRGKICASPNVAPDKNASLTSSTVGHLFNQLSTETFVGSPDPHIVPGRVSVAVLLNRMKSIREQTNHEFFNVVDDLPGDIEHETISALWEPRWMKRRYRSDVAVSFDEVVAYYEDLRAKDPDLAHAFLQTNEHQDLNSIIPYRELRQTLFQHQGTKDLVQFSRTHRPDSPVYIAFLDSDTISLKIGDKGTFTCYEEAILSSAEMLHGLTTGYDISMQQHPHASFAAALDMADRSALATIFPLAPYFPEPNALILVLVGCDTLEVIFPNESKYTSPKEMPLLLRAIVQNRFGGSNASASPHFRFIDRGAIGTDLPTRFLQNRKKKDGTRSYKVFSGKLDEQTHRINGLTAQDLTNVRNTAQSHLKVRDWAMYVQQFLKEFLHPTSIQIVEGNRPGSTVKNGKDQLLISLFASILSAYSPVAITLRAIKEHGYSVVDYLFSLITNYEKRVPNPLNITYGNTNRSTKNTGDLLREHVVSYEKLSAVIDLFYTQPQAARVTSAALACGQSEIPVIIRYVQATQKIAIPRPIEMEPEQFAIVYIKTELTLDNVKTLLRRLYTRLDYKSVDRFVGLRDGNSYRIVNVSKKLSTNVITLWRRFEGQRWNDVIAHFSLSSQNLLDILKPKNPADIEQAAAANPPFLDAFFHLLR